MAAGEFVWADLSMYEPVQACYRDIFAWTIHDGADGYDFAHAGHDPVAGLFPMPQKFRDIGMPSFWMSYVAVESVTDSAEQAVSLGAKLEVHDADNDIALVRDPLGAGFTLCSTQLQPGVTGKALGQRSGHCLHVSDIEKIRPFYETLFGWQFHGNEIQNSNAQKVAGVFEETDEQRSGYEYWSVAFSVPDIDDWTRTAMKHGCDVAGPCNSAPGALSVKDPNGASFVVHPARDDA